MSDVSQQVVRRKRERDAVVCIIGSSPSLTDACRAYYERLCPAGYQIEECLSSDAPSGRDLYLWDYESSPQLPAVMAEGELANKIVVVRKSSLPSLKRNIPDLNFTYLYSPVTPLALRSVLDLATAGFLLHGGGRSASFQVDRDRMLEQLVETNLKLHELNQDRVNFLSRAIHDFRAPLMALQGYCELFLAGQLGRIDPEQSGILKRMQKSLGRLCKLVGTLLDLGPGSHASRSLRLERGNIQTCVQQAVHEVLQFVERKQLSLKVDVEPPRGGLVFDSEQIEHVLLNLLDNACKFTPHGGTIAVRGRVVTAADLPLDGSPDAANSYLLEIADTGRGIDPDHLDDIFDENTSFGGPTDRSGWGLGLAICRMIVQAHRGRIWARSGAHGATFSFVLPIVHSFNHSIPEHIAV